ncbi:MAG TPA: zf-HC2 domain-containing protein [Thermoguttaceae bacterium]|nr:zf-HC2 domain-containing protein [Thermoguttaceae bacterium]
MSSQSCDTVRELLVDYCDGELSAAEAGRVAAHLPDCPNCRAELRMLERSIELARSVWHESAARAPSRAAGGFWSAATRRRFPDVSATGEPCRSCPGSALATSSGGSKSGDESPHSKRSLAWGLLACAVAVLLAAGAWLFWHARPAGRLDRAGLPPALQRPKEPPASTSTQSAATEPEDSRLAGSGEDPNVETLIARVGRAARLAASAELLAAQPGLEPYRAQADRYLAEAYRGTPAGDRAARRVGPCANEPNKEPES